MSNKIISIIIAFIFGLVIFNFLKMKKAIILNYNFDIDKGDNIKINNKCFTSK
jgi:hypothetical protein